MESESNLTNCFKLSSWQRYSAVIYFKAIPHKERTAKRSGKRYNKEVKKQLTMSLISDELGQATLSLMVRAR